MKRIHAPTHLGKIAKRVYVKLHHRAKVKDNELLIMAADSYELWQVAKEEFEEYVEAHNTLLLDNKPHPLNRIMNQSYSTYVSACTKLGIFEHVEEPEDLEIELDKEEDE